jgi:pimeloyl-ACP methyl ester carboxylesterase
MYNPDKMKKLIILHGWGQHAKIWDPFVSQIGDIIETQAWDLPGFGKEPLVSDEWGVPEYADWVVEKVDEEFAAGTEIILLGHSFGGRVSSWIASQNPDWLSGLILSGSPSIYRPSFGLKFRIRLYKFLKKILPSSVLKKIFKPKSLNTADSAGKGKIFRKVVPFDQTEVLEQIKVPALLIWGEKDEPVPLKIALEMNELIPNSKLEIIEGVGHQTGQEAQYLFYGIVKNFIQNL